MTEPKLQKPGAGLPFIEGLIVRYYLAPFVARRAERAEIEKIFETFTAKIAKTAEGLSEEQLRKKVLVVPQRGLEDSSRYWSAIMTIEHVTLVGNHMRRIIKMLSKEEAPDVRVDVAKVKPLGSAPTAQVLKEFEEFRANVIPELAREAQNLDSKTKLFHPWLGKINARQWFWLMASHSGIHLKQIRGIRKDL